MRLVITTDTVGGVWTFTQELTQGLLEQGNSVALVSLGRMPSPAQQSACTALAERWPEQFHYVALDVPLEWMERNQSAYIEAAPLLLKIIEEFKGDALHSNQFCFGALPTSIPKIITAHSDVLSWAGTCRGQALDNSPWLQQYVDLIQHGLAGANAITAPTQWMLDALKQNFACPTASSVIPNGRTVPSFNVATPRKLQAITAGRLWDEAKAIGILNDVSSPMPLLIAGESEYESAQAANSSRNENIVQLGGLSEQDLYNLFRESAIYICTSIYEPFGLAPLEAALCGCALVLRDIPSLREVWGHNALYFDDAASLSNLLHKLYTDTDLLQATRQRSHQQAQRYTRARMTNAYASLFAAMTDRHKEAACVA